MAQSFVGGGGGAGDGVVWDPPPPPGRAELLVVKGSPPALWDTDACAPPPPSLLAGGPLGGGVGVPVRRLVLPGVRACPGGTPPLVDGGGGVGGPPAPTGSGGEEGGFKNCGRWGARSADGGEGGLVGVACFFLGGGATYTPRVTCSPSVVSLRGPGQSPV